MGINWTTSRSRVTMSPHSFGTVGGESRSEQSRSGRDETGSHSSRAPTASGLNLYRPADRGNVRTLEYDPRVNDAVALPVLQSRDGIQVDLVDFVRIERIIRRASMSVIGARPNATSFNHST